MNKETLKKGTRIYYNGDMANEEGLGVIENQQTDSWGTHLEIKMDDGRTFNVTTANFSEEYLGHGGTRFVTEEAYNKFRQAAVDKIEAQLKENKEEKKEEEAECEACHKLFKGSEIIWDLVADRAVCLSCYKEEDGKGVAEENIFSNLMTTEPVEKKEEEEPERISLTDTAKIVRSLLKKEFPEAKFSVRSRSYSGGSSIDVDWTDGPSTKKVEALVGKYHGAEFDGMQDLKTYNKRPYDNDFIFCHREYSTAVLDKKACEILDSYGTPLEGKKTFLELRDIRIANQWLGDFLHRELREEDL